MNARERLQDMIRTERGDMNVYSQPEIRDALDAHRVEVLTEGINALRKWQADRNPTLLPGLNHAIGVLTSVRDHRDEEQGTASAADRQAALLTAIRAYGGRWKSGRACRNLHQLGYTGVGKQTAANDLARLADAGHLTRHEEIGVRFYTLNTRKDSR